MCIRDRSQRDIITYFTGVRAPTFEEDFVIERGRKTKNLIHCAGIQSPGLTTAPAVAKDVAKMAAKMVSVSHPVKKNESYNPYRKGVPRLREMSPEQRNKLIQKRPDYGVCLLYTSSTIILKTKMNCYLRSQTNIWTSSGQSFVSGRIMQIKILPFTVLSVMFWNAT